LTSIELKVPNNWKPTEIALPYGPTQESMARRGPICWPNDITTANVDFFSGLDDGELHDGELEIAVEVEELVGAYGEIAVEFEELVGAVATEVDELLSAG
jgi:hypothetical protein